MRLLGPGKMLAFVLLLLSAEQVFTQSALQSMEGANFARADTSFHEFQRHILSWDSEHPELATSRVVTQGERPGAKTVRLNFRATYPTLDIYSAAGVPVYFSDSSETSLKVIDALPLVMPEADLNPGNKVRPSLREALSMVPGIPRSDWAPSSQFDYTVLVVLRNRTGDNPAQSNEGSASHGENKAIEVQNMNASGPRIMVTTAPMSAEEAQRMALAREASMRASEAENEALERLKTRLRGSRIRVIEVRLLEP